jgi:hypothetical protein
MLSLPYAKILSPLLIEPAVLIARVRNAVMVYQLVSPSTHFIKARSNLRYDEARRNEVIGKPSVVTMWRGVVATKPVTDTSSDIVPFVDYFGFVLLYVYLTTPLRQMSNLFTSVFASLREREEKINTDCQPKKHKNPTPESVRLV